MTDRQSLLLAACAAEFDTNITSMKALNSQMQGLLFAEDLFADLENERDELLERFADRTGEPRTVEAARAYCTAHGAELEEVLRRE